MKHFEIKHNEFYGTRDAYINIIKPWKTLSKIALLKIAIEKWQMIVDYVKEYPTIFLDERGVESCPLCRKYYHALCEGCPIKMITNKIGCNDTPYTDFIDTGKLKDAQNEVRFLTKILTKLENEKK